ncbi:hypothetical protein HPB52_001852 [Rhipicephalus sanguineus]|uniref:Uncharacterized protein n=1 Tax=Rhipicephalus sanguineus TaxID=34632 RepID=A0A9D4PKC7_RHISA|nr:hypothetical protein HPB52_001852 [Rhipicephalus sanguineus]
MAAAAMATGCGPASLHVVTIENTSQDQAMPSENEYLADLVKQSQTVPPPKAKGSHAVARQQAATSGSSARHSPERAPHLFPHQCVNPMVDTFNGMKLPCFIFYRSVVHDVRPAECDWVAHLAQSHVETDKQSLPANHWHGSDEAVYASGGHRASEICWIKCSLGVHSFSRPTRQREVHRIRRVASYSG